MARRVASSRSRAAVGLVGALGRDEIGVDLADVLGQRGGLLVGAAFRSGPS